jgi:KUP system potassium uptake protein
VRAASWRSPRWSGACPGSSARLASIALALGVLGASLFYGDSLITPAISVLSAVEGLKVARPELASAVLPLGIAILALLFVVQRWGTHQVGRLFGPVMVLWFATLAVLGVPHIAARPSVLLGLSPTYAMSFFAVHPLTAFLAMGAVVLVITGAEALYADVGHFGRRPIRVAWFVLAFPALTLNYLGQAALILTDPHAVDNPFYRLAPGWAQLPLVVLATCATVIASQAVISGAFSVSRQAVRLGYLPPLTVRHTSTQESGQIYLPAVNWLLFGGVLMLIVVFGSSNRLATAYGLAVTGTLLLTTTLFVIYATNAWHWARWKLVLVAIVFGGVELTFLTANLTKIVHGGWLPLLVATVVATVMTTWQRGRRIVTTRRVEVEGPLLDFVDKLNADGIARVPGTAVFPHPTKQTAPLALRANVEFNHVLHERVVIVSVQSENVPHVPPGDRVTIDQLGHPADGIVHLLAPARLPGRPAHPRPASGVPRPLRRTRNRHRHRVVLPVPHHHRTRLPAGHEYLAQATVHRPRPQRGHPGHLLQTAPRPHRGDGLAHRTLIELQELSNAERRLVTTSRPAAPLVPPP